MLRREVVSTVKRSKKGWKLALHSHRIESKADDSLVQISKPAATAQGIANVTQSQLETPRRGTSKRAPRLSSNSSNKKGSDTL